MLLLSSKSALKDPNNMVLSQVHSFFGNSERDQEREDNNNTITVKRDLLQTPPPRCRFINSAKKKKQSANLLSESSIKIVY